MNDNRMTALAPPVPPGSVLPPERPALSLAERVDPRRAATLFIDLQHDFCSPGGAIARVLEAWTQAAGAHAGVVSASHVITGVP